MSTNGLVVMVIGFWIGWVSTTGHKSQQVRLLDIGVIGPLMIGMGMVTAQRYGMWAYLLTFLGATTVTYNLKNYLSHS